MKNIFVISLLLVSIGGNAQKIDSFLTILPTTKKLEFKPDARRPYSTMSIILNMPGQDFFKIWKYTDSSNWHFPEIKDTLLVMTKIIECMWADIERVAEIRNRMDSINLKRINQWANAFRWVCMENDIGEAEVIRVLRKYSFTPANLNNNSTPKHKL